MKVKRVWKFQLPIIDEFELMMPKGAQILSAQIQTGIPCLWALVDPDEGQELKRFRMAGTGHIIAEDAVEFVFIGTFQFDGLVIHLFEVKPE